MNPHQQRVADRAIKETRQAIDAIRAAHQVVEVREVQVGEIYNGDEQTMNSVVIRFFPRFDGTSQYEDLADALTITTP